MAYDSIGMYGGFNGQSYNRSHELPYDWEAAKRRHAREGADHARQVFKDIDFKANNCMATTQELRDLARAWKHISPYDLAYNKFFPESDQEDAICTMKTIAGGRLFLGLMDREEFDFGLCTTYYTSYNVPRRPLFIECLRSLPEPDQRSIGLSQQFNRVSMHLRGRWPFSAHDSRGRMPAERAVDLIECAEIFDLQNIKPQPVVLEQRYSW